MPFNVFTIFIYRKNASHVFIFIGQAKNSVRKIYRDVFFEAS